MMLNQCANLGKVTASSGERKSILKTSSKRVGSKSPPKDLTSLGLDQSFVSTSEGLCHSLVLQSKFGTHDPNTRSKSGSKSRSNSNKKAPWRPNSVVAPIPSHPEPVSYSPPMVVLKPDHHLYESVSAIKSATKASTTQKKQRGLIRDTQPAMVNTTDKPNPTAASSVRRSRLYDPRPSQRQTQQAKDSVFEASSLSLHEPEAPKKSLRTAKSVRTVTFGNSISDGAPMKPRSVAPEERHRPTSVNRATSRDVGKRSAAVFGGASTGGTASKAGVNSTTPATTLATGTTTKHFVKGRTTTNNAQTKEEPRRSNIQRNNKTPVVGARGTSGSQRERSGSATKLNRDLANWTLGGNVNSSMKIGIGEFDSESPMDHEHLPGQTGCSICIYNFGKNLPYETKHLAKLYAARRDEYQKQILSNPDLALLDPLQRSRSNSKSAERNSRPSSRMNSAAKTKATNNSLSGRSTANTQIKCESTGSSSLERARRLKKELNQAVQQQKVTREPTKLASEDEEQCLERLGLRGSVNVQQILQRYSTQGGTSVVDSELEMDEAPRASIGLHKAEPARRSSPALRGTRLSVSSSAQELEESGVLVKPNGDRYEFRLKKIS